MSYFSFRNEIAGLAQRMRPNRNLSEGARRPQEVYEEWRAYEEPTESEKLAEATTVIADGSSDEIEQADEGHIV